MKQFNIRQTMQQGFTLIELVMVIVILGVLAAVAIPKFIDLKADSANAALAGVAGAMNSAMAINYAARSVNATKGVTVTDCNTAGVLQGAALPAGYTITPAALGSGVSASCTLTSTGLGASPATTTFTGIGIP